MNIDIGWGIVGVLLGGFLNGSWVLPMKRMPKWRWENTWLAFSVLGLILIPWLVALETVPQLERLSGVLPGPRSPRSWFLVSAGVWETSSSAWG